VEMDLKAASNLMGLNYIVFRPHNVYGERQNISDRYRNVIGIFMNRIMNNQEVTIFGDGKQTRAFSYIKDIVPIIAKSIEKPEVYGKTFNIGGDVPCSLNELAYKVCEAMEVNAPEERIVHLEERYEVKHAHTVHHELRKYFPEFGVTTSLDKGLSIMAKWAKETGPQKSEHYGEYELTKNMPKFWVK
jgi:UDP-glucose 4-epimerase